MLSVIRNLCRRLGRSCRPAGPAVAEYPQLADALTAAGREFSAWLAGLQADPKLYSSLSTETLQGLRRRFPAQLAHTIRAADTVLQHRFNLLGSGEFVPVDPERPVSAEYVPIDWYLDPVSGLRFPRGVPHKEWDLYAMRPGNADIKYPWELGRCQHWAPLAQAYALTGDKRYAEEISHQLDDFMEANPLGMGINWTCTMDVAIRAYNWAMALDMLKNAGQFGQPFWESAYAALYAHAWFIRHNLENNYEVTSNHFLSNVVGLYALVAIFEGLPGADEWDGFCRQALEREIQVQVLDDGADYESSVPYHRLVTELFMGAAHLARHRGQELSSRYTARLTRMVDFMAGVLRPDGLMPQIGDADDGRLHIFTDYGTWNPQDPSHLFAPAAFLLNRPEWLVLGGENGLWEAAWWGHAVGDVASGPKQPPPANYLLYPDAGLAVCREEGSYLLVSNGIVGTKGFGNHKHNDQLGFEYHCDGIPLVVDPGSYVYTSDFAARNRFRGTGFHSTVMVAGQEQNELRPEWIFRLFETAHAEHRGFEVSDDLADYCGQHIGYRRLDPPVSHQRRFRLHRESGVLLIADELPGCGGHRLQWHFHFAPGVVASRIDDRHYRLEAAGRRFVLSCDQGLGGELSEGLYSPSYGVAQGCRCLDLFCPEVARGDFWFFVIAPEESGVDHGQLRQELLREKKG